MESECESTNPEDVFLLRNPNNQAVGMRRVDVYAISSAERSGRDVAPIDSRDDR